MFKVMRTERDEETKFGERTCERTCQHKNIQQYINQSETRVT